MSTLAAVLVLLLIGSVVAAGVIHAFAEIDRLIERAEREHWLDELWADDAETEHERPRLRVVA